MSVSLTINNFQRHGRHRFSRRSTERVLPGQLSSCQALPQADRRRVAQTPVNTGRHWPQLRSRLRFIVASSSLTSHVQQHLPYSTDDPVASNHPTVYSHNQSSRLLFRLQCLLPQGYSFFCLCNQLQLIMQINIIFKSFSLFKPEPNTILTE